MPRIPPFSIANEGGRSSSLPRQNRFAHVDSSLAASRTTSPLSRAPQNTDALSHPESIGGDVDIDDYGRVFGIDNYAGSPVDRPVVQEGPCLGSQSFPRNLTQRSDFRTVPSSQLYSHNDTASTQSLETKSCSVPPSRPISPGSISIHAPTLTPSMPAPTVPPISSGRASGTNSIDSKRPRPKFLQSTTLNSSTTSLSSLSSVRSTSSNSPLYLFKKPPMDLKLPFSNQDATSSDIQEFMRFTQERQEKRSRNSIVQNCFKAFWLSLVACTVYFVFIGLPLWDGVVYKCWKWANSSLVSKYGLIAFLLWGSLLTWLPLLFCAFEREVGDTEKRDASETCLVIPAYKAADALRDTIPHALKIFKPEQIFIIANGNSPTPLDDTEEVCKEFGVNHFWVPIGSKIVAEFVGVYLAKDYKYCLLTDDDVHLPANLPIVVDRIKGKTACVGYTIKSTGANGSAGTVFQQAQDIEYKLAGISKVFQSKYGSATFPHGAIILWDRTILEKLFFGHPGYRISEDWYFGHTCRSAGFRVDFCSQVFVETETPPCLFIPTKSNRGGYGEMTIWKQRFYRWNFFFLYRLINDIPYLLFAWRLGWRELITKLFVFAEVYETLLYISRPFMLPTMLAADWAMTLMMTAALLAVYVLGFIFFNAFHLRRKNEMIAWKILPVYFGMKIALMFVGTASMYYSMFAYARFFSVRHSRVVENHDALEAVRKFLQGPSPKQPIPGRSDQDAE